MCKSQEGEGDEESDKEEDEDDGDEKGLYRVSLVTLCGDSLLKSFLFTDSLCRLSL